MNPNRRFFRLLHRISALVAADEALWAELGTLIREFSVKSDEPESKTSESEVNDESSSSTSTAPDVEVNRSCPKNIMPEQKANPAGPVASPELARSEIPSSGHQTCGTLELVANCEMKRDGCRWVLERLRRKEMGANHLAEIAPGDRAILEKAKELPDCHLWMNRPTAPMPDDLSHYATLAGCFEALAAVLSIAASTQEMLAENIYLFEKLLSLVAEAQSAVREAVRRVGGPTDQDQIDAFWWVRPGRSTSQNLMLPIVVSANSASNSSSTWSGIV